MPDSLIFYYHPANIGLFDSYSFGDYVARITNPVLGFFRLQPYIEAPGNLMVDNQRTPGSIAGVTGGTQCAILCREPYILQLLGCISLQYMCWLSIR